MRGAEHTAQDFVAHEMRVRGLDVDRWRIDIDDIKHLPGFSPVHVNYDNRPQDLTPTYTIHHLKELKAFL